MSVTGKLDEFRLPELLQMLAQGRKSGKLRLSQRDSEGLVVFRDGKIIYAASSTIRETLGNLLLVQGQVSAETLHGALERQRASADERRLGSILVDMGALDAETLRDTVTGQTERVILEFLEWETGYFDFQAADIPDQGEIAVDAEDFLLREGVAPQRILVSLAAQLAEEDEATELAQPSPFDGVSDKAVDAALATAFETGPEDVAPVAPPAEPPPQRDRTTLRSLMADFRSPEFTGEITSRILDFAGRVMDRAVLLLIRRDRLVGMGQVGVSDEPGMTTGAVRRIEVPLDEPSLFAQVVGSRETFVGPVEPEAWSRYLTSGLPGGPPAEVLLAPLVVNDRVMMVLYGDNSRSARSLDPPRDELELVMLQAGLAIEKRLLEKRVDRLESLRVGQTG